MNESEVRDETQNNEVSVPTAAEPSVSKKSQPRRKKRQVKRRTKPTGASVPPRKRSAIRLHLRQGED